MIKKGCMELLYEGLYDRTLFDSFAKPQDSQKTSKIISSYLNILEDYPSQSLEDAGKIPMEMLDRMGKSGLFGITIPEEYGGLGLSLLDCEKIIESLAPTDLSVALVFLAHLLIGMKGIELYGTEKQKRHYLPLAASGEMIFAFALTEPGTGSDARHIESQARLSENGKYYLLNGSKTYITNAGYAGCITVFAQLDPQKPGFMGAFIVETSSEGLEVGRDMPKLGLKASSTASLKFKDVRIPRESMLGTPGDGFKIAMTILHYGRMGLAAASKGLSEQCHVDMLKRARSRIQFGKAIADFPLIQEKIVQAKVSGTVMGAMNYMATSLLENDPDHGAVIETSHCKLFGTNRAWEKIYDTLQVFGGAGYISTHPFGKRMRDFRVTTIFEGTTEIHSIYPPLIALSRMAKELKKRKNIVRRSLYLIVELVLTFARVPSIPGCRDDRRIRRAVILARCLAGIIKRRLLLGLVIYAKKVSEKEYFLKRINTLSIYLFGIVSMLAMIKYENKNGPDSYETLSCLELFVEEAKEYLAANRFVLYSRSENKTTLLFKKMNSKDNSKNMM